MGLLFVKEVEDNCVSRASGAKRLRKIIISLAIGGAVFIAADHFTWLMSHDEDLSNTVGIITGIIAVYIGLNKLPLPSPNFTVLIAKAKSIKDKLASKLAERDANKPD